MVEYLSLQWKENWSSEDKDMSPEKWIRGEFSVSTKQLIALPQCVQEFLRTKRKILAEANASEKIFAKFGFGSALNRCNDIYERQLTTLVKEVPELLFDPQSSFDEELFSSTVRGNAAFGRYILDRFKADKTQIRADQLITWLMSSGDSILAYARVSVTPKTAQYVAKSEVLVDKRSAWNTLTKRNNVPNFELPMVAS